MSVLEFDCRFAYPSGFALDLSFTAGSGVTALQGPSGVGKTTVLLLIAGILTPASGRMALAGRVLFDSSRGTHVPTHQRRIGLVFQDYQLFPHLTVMQNLQYGMRRAARAEFDLSHLIDVLEIQTLLRRYPASLSGGQRQRVALGRAIATKPSLLLLDEPISALHEDLKLGIIHYLNRTLKEYQIPTLLVTHDAGTIAHFGADVLQLPTK
jgi:molybdate transport system ATP-binding protein